MNIHTKINERQAYIVANYISGVFWEPNPKAYMYKTMPKYLRYGGHRNTCYDKAQIGMQCIIYDRAEKLDTAMHHLSLKKSK